METGNASRCSKEKTKKRWSRKRRFKGNQHTLKKKDIDEEQISSDKTLMSSDASASEKTVSEKKIRNVVKENEKPLDGYRLIDVGILLDLVSSLCCPECLTPALTMEENELKRKGLASYISITCSHCSYSWEKYLSHGTSIDKRAMDVNIRSVYAMRKCGVGYGGLVKFCGVMNMLPPVNKKNYSNLSKKIGDAAEKVAKNSMIQAALDVKEVDGKDSGISFDGTWQKRGHSSLNGVAAAISVTSGKVLDVEILSKHCKACAEKESLRTSDPHNYETWKTIHMINCQAV